MPRQIGREDLAHDSIASTQDDFTDSYETNRWIEVLLHDFLGVERLPGKTCLKPHLLEPQVHPVRVVAVDVVASVLYGERELREATYGDAERSSLQTALEQRAREEDLVPVRNLTHDGAPALDEFVHPARSGERLELRRERDVDA